MAVEGAIGAAQGVIGVLMILKYIGVRRRADQSRRKASPLEPRPTSTQLLAFRNYE
jgi:hypothetical protein